MAYDAKNATVVENLRAGIVEQGVVVNVADGKVGDFLTDKGKDKWEGDHNTLAIQVTVEVLHDNTKYNCERLFTYFTQADKTVFKSNSNLGKYFRYYKKLPEVGDQVQCKTDADVYFRLVID